MFKDEIAFDSTTVSLSREIPPPAERRSGERQLTILRIAKLIADNGEELCRIRNISAGGLKVETCSQHRVGERVVIELRADQRLAGSVAWSRDSSIGVVFDELVDVAQVLVKAAGDERRYTHQPRVQAPCFARIWIDSVVHRIPVTDISQGGMKVELNRPVSVGDRVSVKVDGLPGVEGAIRWFRNDQAGIAFDVQVPFDQLTRWLGMRLAGRRPASNGSQAPNATGEERAA